MRSITKGKRLGSVVAIAALALAACGSDGGGTTDSTAATTAGDTSASETTASESTGSDTTAPESTESERTESETTAAESLDPVDLSVSLIPGVLYGFPPYLAQQLGMFDESMTIELLPLKNGPESVAAMAGGDVDIVSVVAAGATFPAIEGGQDLRVLGLGTTLDFAFAGQPDLGGDMSSLAGQTVGVAALGGQGEKIARAIMSEAGVDDNSVTFVAVGLGAPKYAAFQNNQIQAMLVSNSELPTMDAQGLEYQVLFNSSSDPTTYASLPDVWTVVSPELAADDAGVLDRYCSAVAEAIDFAKDPANLDEVSKQLVAFGAEYGVALDEQSATDVWSNVNGFYFNKMDPATWDSAVEFAGVDAANFSMADYVVECG